MRTYFDVAAKDLRRYARYDAASGLYPWTAIGPWNRVQQFQSQDENKNVFLIPFYIFSHENRFEEYEKDEAKLGLLKQE